jgi:hypothetical protein
MDFLETVNDIWQALTGRGLTPLEWAFAEALEIAGVPLPAVREGMARCFRFFCASPGQPRIRTFMYCMSSIVDTAVEMYPETHWQARRSTPPLQENGGREEGSDPLLVREDASVPKLLLGAE